jgi:hypothetical protein
VRAGVVGDDGLERGQQLCGAGRRVPGHGAQVVGAELDVVGGGRGGHVVILPCRRAVPSTPAPPRSVVPLVRGYASSVVLRAGRRPVRSATAATSSDVYALRVPEIDMPAAAARVLSG